jgi:hypothetical protein
MLSKEDYKSYLKEFGLSEEQILKINEIHFSREKEAVFMYDFIVSNTKDFKQWSKKEQENFINSFVSAHNEDVNYLVSFQNDTIWDLVCKIKKDNFIKPYAGVYPSYCYNAHCTTVNDNYLILLDTGCFEMIEHFVLIFFSNRNNATKTKLIKEIINDYCENYKYPNNHFDEDFIDSTKKGLSTYIINWTEYFAYCHEYGHIANNHLKENVNLCSLPFNKEIKVFSKSQQQEFDADLWGSYLLLEHAKQKPDPTFIDFACSCPLIFLGIALLIEKHFKEKGITLDTHPPAIKRIGLLRLNYYTLGMKEQMQFGMKFLDFINECHFCIYKSYFDIPFLDTELLLTMGNSYMNTKLSLEDFGKKRKKVGFVRQLINKIKKIR